MLSLCKNGLHFKVLKGRCRKCGCACSARYNQTKKVMLERRDLDLKRRKRFYDRHQEKLKADSRVRYSRRSGNKPTTFWWNQVKESL